MVARRLERVLKEEKRAAANAARMLRQDQPGSNYVGSKGDYDLWESRLDRLSGLLR
jgi:hypothetical protein